MVRPISMDCRTIPRESPPRKKFNNGEFPEESPLQHFLAISIGSLHSVGSRRSIFLLLQRHPFVLLPRRNRANHRDQKENQSKERDFSSIHSTRTHFDGRLARLELQTSSDTVLVGDGPGWQRG